MVQGYQFWVDQLNNAGGITLQDGSQAEVGLVYYDDADSQDTTERFYDGMATGPLSDGTVVDFFLGPFGSSHTKRARTAATDNEKVLMASNAATDNSYGGGWIFGVQTPTSRYCGEMISRLQARGASSVGMITTNGFFTNLLTRDCRAELVEAGMAIAYEGTITDGEHDTAWLAALDVEMANIAALDVDILMGFGELNDGEELVDAAKRLEFTPKAFFLSSAGANPEFVTDVGADSNFILSSAQWIANSHLPGGDFFGSSDDFVANYAALHGGEEPTYYAAQASVAGYMMQLAIANVADVTDQAAVRDALFALDRVDTFYGAVDFDPDTGINTAKEQIVTQIQNQAIVNVASEGFEEAELYMVYPTPEAITYGCPGVVPTCLNFGFT